MMVLLLAHRRGRLEPVTLLLVGVIVSAVCGAVYLLLYHLKPPQRSLLRTAVPSAS